MITLGKKQMMAFSEQRLHSFVKRMVYLLQHEFIKEINVLKLNNNDLEIMVFQGIMTAEKYHIIQEYDLELYLQCMLLLNPKFDNDFNFPWATTILNNNSLSGNQKMDQINNYLLFSLSEEK
jgi:hypothetical protein